MKEEKPIVFPNSSRKISYSEEFNFNLEKFKHLSFLKRYLHAYAETTATDILITVNGKTYYYREILFMNPQLSHNEIFKILEVKNLKLKLAYDAVTSDHVASYRQPKRIFGLKL